MIDFSKPYHREGFVKFLTNFLPEDFVHETAEVSFKGNSFTTNAVRLGKCRSLELEVFEIEHTSTHDARVGLSREAFQMLLNNSYCNRALVAFVPADSGQYRFSLLQIEAETNDKTSRISRNYSNPRRYSFLLGEGKPIKTPKQFLCDEGKIRAQRRGNKDFTLWEDLCYRFSVEVLTKEFYTELFNWYQWALSDEMKVVYPANNYKIEEHLIRLITRLMFVWFIKQKKLIPENIFDIDELKKILNYFDPISQTQGDYYNAILQNLFFATLNRKIEERAFTSKSTLGTSDGKEHYGIKTLFRDDNQKTWFKQSHEEIINLFRQVPFLNGGLFECLDKEKDNNNDKIVYFDGFSRDERNKFGQLTRAFIPNRLFFDEGKGLISILKRYNFTIEENTPIDVDVALDPELLGKVFENLLGAYNPETKETARKQSGSFYTPREIVNYMVDESLVAYLKQTVGEQYDEEYRKLLTGSTEMPSGIKSQIYNALRNCKILDPACGSGAFPMGILNRIISMMEQLGLPPHISIFDLKLHLIENCIFGIDIQTIAVQISKLRFFISLIVEQNPIPDAGNNYGIKPLPNLETKFVAANTLIGIQAKEAQGNLFEDPQIDVTKKELWQVRHKHFSANTPKEKEECRAEDEKLRNKLAKLLEANDIFAPENAKQLAMWNPYNQNASSPFFDAEWMFGLKDGFDIVIVDVKALNDKDVTTYFKLYKTTSNRINLYSIFIEQGYSILNTNGILCFINPNSMLVNSSYKKLRELILSDVVSIVKLPDHTFESATVETIVFLLQKNKTARFVKGKYYLSNEHANLKTIIYSIYDKNIWKCDSDVRFNIFTNSETVSLLNKIELNALNLANLADFSLGITPYDKAKGHSQSLIKSRGFHSDRKISDEYVPLIKGSNIEKYVVTGYSDEFLKYSFELGAPRQQRFFTDEKIIVRQILSTNPLELIAAYSNESHYFTQIGFSIIPKSKNLLPVKFLLCLLNSKLINYFHTAKYLDVEKITFPKILIENCKQFPIKLTENTKPFVDLVDKILIAKHQNSSSDTADLERQIDRLVYELYGLTEEDIKIIDGGK